MATVYDASDPRFERNVAIKVLPREFLHDPQFRARFEREAKTVALLEHPAIVPVYDFGEHDGQPYIVMQLMNGGSLADRLEKGAITPAEAAKILTRLGQALDVAHSKGIIHRDLKPANILFDHYGNAFLSDFGIARLREAGGATLTGSQIIGTPAYMSPEQIQGEKTIDGRSDIYALGVILFLMLSNEMPFKADTPAKVMIAHIIEPAPSILIFKEDLPPGIDGVIDRALAKDPDDRYQTASEMAEDFAEVVRASQALTRPTPVTEPTLDAQTPKTATVTRLSAPKPGTWPGRTVTPQPSTSPPTTAPQPQAKPVKPHRPWILFVIGGVIVLAILIGGGFLIAALAGGGRGTPVAAATTEVAATPSPTEIPPNPTEEATPTQAQIAVAATDSPEPTENPTLPPAETPTELPTELPVAGPPVIGGADKIAYIRDREIRVVNLDGSNEITMTSDGGLKTNLQWTSDGKELFYIDEKCIRALDLNLTATFTACFLNAGRLEGYSISALGDQFAIAMDNELFIVPFDRTQFSPVSTRKNLMDMATCTFYAPLNNSKDHKYKDIRWSRDDQTIAVKISGVGNGATAGLNVDQILTLDISSCDDFSRTLDIIPGVRFNIDEYDEKPVLTSWDWNRVLNLFAMTSYTSRDNFGELYIYNGERQTGEKYNPLGGICCYRDARWSPDGTHLLFAYQEFAPGAPTELYLVSYGTGALPTPLPLIPLTNQREFPEPALRPATRTSP